MWESEKIYLEWLDSARVGLVLISVFLCSIGGSVSTCQKKVSPLWSHGFLCHFSLRACLVSVGGLDF